MRLPVRLLPLTWVVVALATCDAGDDRVDAPRCAALRVDVDACTPQYPALFERIHTETLRPSCGVTGGACHGEADATGAATGLWIADDPDAAWSILRGDDGPAFVHPGDPECGPVVARLGAEDPEVVMPPGSAALPEGIRCAIAQWIADGAPR